MALDLIKILLCALFVSTGGATSKGTDCPSNTVEIVFTKKGVICATTSSVPELNHLSIDPKHIRKLLREPPIVQKVSIPDLSHHFMSAQPPPHHLFLQQMAMNQELQMLGQPMPAQHMLVQPSAEEFMVRRLPVYHENVINRNLEYVDRRPDLMEDKRLYYQRMLWEKLRRDAFIKKLIGNNPNQLYGVQYVEDNNLNENLNHQNNDLPEKTTEEQTHSSQQTSQQNEQKVEDNSAEKEKPKTPELSSQEVTESEGQSLNDNHNNDYNDNQSQEPIDQKDSPNEKELILKQYLKYLNQKEESPQEEQKTLLQRDSRQYDVGLAATNSRVPDIIRGVMPAVPAPTNGHTYGMKMYKNNEYVPDEPMSSQSQVSYQFARPDSPQYNQNLMQSLRFPQNEETGDLRLVATGMTFGHRINTKDTEAQNFGYGYKSYPEYNYAKSKQLRAKSKFVGQPLVKDKEPSDEDVVLVTADPNQIQIIETLEAHNSRRNHRKFSDDWTGSQDFSDDNRLEKKVIKDFRLDESRIEYNGWRPLRNQDRPSEERPQEEQELVKSSSSPGMSVLPITGRVSNRWKAI